MTTEFSRNQSPRLPANYPEHLERVLSKQPTTRNSRLFWLSLAFAAVAILSVYGLLSA